MAELKQRNTRRERRSFQITAEENQTNSGERNQQNIGPLANVSGVLVQSVGGNGQVGGKEITQFGGKREKRKF